MGAWRCEKCNQEFATVSTVQCSAVPYSVFHMRRLFCFYASFDIEFIWCDLDFSYLYHPSILFCFFVFASIKSNLIKSHLSFAIRTDYPKVRPLSHRHGPERSSLAESLQWNGTIRLNCTGSSRLRQNWYDVRHALTLLALPKIIEPIWFLSSLIF